MLETFADPEALAAATEPPARSSPVFPAAWFGTACGAGGPEEAQVPRVARGGRVSTRALQPRPKLKSGFVSDNDAKFRNGSLNLSDINE